VAEEYLCLACNQDWKLKGSPGDARRDRNLRFVVSASLRRTASSIKQFDRNGDGVGGARMRKCAWCALAIARVSPTLAPALWAREPRRETSLPHRRSAARNPRRARASAPRGADFPRARPAGSLRGPESWRDQSSSTAPPPGAGKATRCLESTDSGSADWGVCFRSRGGRVRFDRQFAAIVPGRPAAAPGTGSRRPPSPRGPALALLEARAPLAHGLPDRGPVQSLRGIQYSSTAPPAGRERRSGVSSRRIRAAWREASACTLVEVECVSIGSSRLPLQLVPLPPRASLPLREPDRDVHGPLHVVLHVPALALLEVWTGGAHGLPDRGPVQTLGGSRPPAQRRRRGRERRWPTASQDRARRGARGAGRRRACPEDDDGRTRPVRRHLCRVQRVMRPYLEMLVARAAPDRGGCGPIRARQDP
jgi:hypothetical protein